MKPISDLGNTILEPAGLWRDTYLSPLGDPPSDQATTPRPGYSLPTVSGFSSPEPMTTMLELYPQGIRELTSPLSD
jgi:hypothetical protein